MIIGSEKISSGSNGIAQDPTFRLFCLDSIGLDKQTFSTLYEPI